MTKPQTDKPGQSQGVQGVGLVPARPERKLRGPAAPEGRWQVLARPQVSPGAHPIPDGLSQVTCPHHRAPQARHLHTKGARWTQLGSLPGVHSGRAGTGTRTPQAVLMTGCEHGSVQALQPGASAGHLERVREKHRRVLRDSPADPTKSGAHIVFSPNRNNRRKGTRSRVGADRSPGSTDTELQP